MPEADAKIVFDRFHVMGHVLEALDEVRRKEQRVLKHADDQRLTGTKFLRLTSTVDRFSWAQQLAVTALRASTLKSARAWALMEMIHRLWEFRSIPRARAFSARWHRGATHSRLAPMRCLAKTLQVHREYILTYRTNRNTNPVTAGLLPGPSGSSTPRGASGIASGSSGASIFFSGGLDLEPCAEKILSVNPF